MRFRPKTVRACVVMIQVRALPYYTRSRIEIQASFSNTPSKQEEQDSDTAVATRVASEENVSLHLLHLAAFRMHSWETGRGTELKPECEHKKSKQYD